MGAGAVMVAWWESLPAVVRYAIIAIELAWAVQVCILIALIAGFIG
jgi:hypothetical protein